MINSKSLFLVKREHFFKQPCKVLWNHTADLKLGICVRSSAAHKCSSLLLLILYLSNKRQWGLRPCAVASAWTRIFWLASLLCGWKGVFRYFNKMLSSNIFVFELYMEEGELKLIGKYLFLINLYYNPPLNEIVHIFLNDALKQFLNNKSKPKSKFSIWA